MDPIKTGEFIASLRKKNNMTQSEFGEKLCVTAQAVSKWENGRGLPDITILKKISEEFDTDISFLLGSKKKKNIIPYIVGVFLVALLVTVIILVNNKAELSSAKIVSDNSAFKISGIAAYSKEKKLIFISDINYVSNENIDDKYVVMECSLFENTNDGYKKISQCGSIDNKKIYSKNESYTLDELLQDISFNVDFKSNCKDLNNHSLYLSINALDVNNKVITYKVPLDFDEKCN